MCNEADNSGQDIQDEAKSGLWSERKEAEKSEFTMKIKHVLSPLTELPREVWEMCQDPASTDLEGDEYCAGTDGESNHSHEGTHDQVWVEDFFLQWAQKIKVLITNTVQ